MLVHIAKAEVSKEEELDGAKLNTPAIPVVSGFS